MGYLLKECLANAGNYGGTRTAAQIKYLVFHYTGNDGDKAANNAAYFQNNIVKASAHYFVDDACVYRSVPDLRVAWAVGGSKYPNAAATGGGTMYGKITNTNSRPQRGLSGQRGHPGKRCGAGPGADGKI